MNYILLDLEWNDAYFKKLHGFVNEIVEFGAVKLDENFNEVDRFVKIVRSSITNRLSSRFKELTGMTNEQMQSGIPFDEALKQYKQWAGQDTITLTWSNSDLHTLYHNCVNFISDASAAQIGKYVDLQKYFQYELGLMGNPQKNQISLSNAATLFGVNFSDESLHHALDDSYLSAAILRKCYNKEHFELFITDTSSNNFYEKMMYKAHYINNMNHPLIKKEDLHIFCPKCKKRAEKISSWRLKKPWFHTTFLCKECNLKFKGAVAFKRFYDKVEVKKRVFEPSVKVTVEKSTKFSGKEKNSFIKTK